MKPKVWRFVGFGSAVVGLLCYALSSSFNYLFGNWNFLKIFLYIVFSLIICLMILFAKILQYSRSLKFKAHTAFLVLTITSVYSFFFDKVVNGKPDAYSLISCVAFAIMSLSLSRQTECGFEVDLLYFFLGCLIVQLMKIKLQLFFLGAGFSYSLIILRSSFSTVDSIGDNQYLNLQDGNSVVLHMDSLQLASTNIVTTSDSRNSIDSQQLVISTDIGTMIEKLETYVKALQHQNSNLLQILLEHVKKYVEEHSQLVVTDSNFMMDALKLETVKGLEETAKVMLSDGYEKDFSDVYNNCRRECLNAFLNHRLFGLSKLNIEDVRSMPWKDLEDHIEKWIKAFNVAVKILFPGERRLCDRIFFGYSHAADFSFMEICKGSVIQLLNFADFVAKGSLSPERLFKMLEVFETLRDLIPEFESLFCDQYGVSLRNEAIKIWKRLGEAIRGIFMELEDLIDNSPLYGAMHRIMDTLESNFNARSKFYDGPSLGYIFLMNNDTYIVHMTKDNELGTLLGNDWIRKHALKVWHYNGKYKKTMGTIASNLVQDFFQSKIGGEDVRQLSYNPNQIVQIDEGNMEVSKGSKGYEGYMQEIEASPLQRRERYVNFILNSSKIIQYT